MTSMVVNPTSSYQVTVPDDIRAEYDTSVTSFWVEGEQTVLQMSSYLRTDGPQVSAEERLRDRMAANRRSWKVWGRKIHADSTVDQATAEFLDGEVLWIFSYLVWPHIVVLATIIGPMDQVSDGGNWTFAAIRTIHPTSH